MGKAKASEKYAHVDLRSLKQRVLRFLHGRGLARAGDRLGVAVSGGADSVALLLLLLEMREELGLILSVVHFNHKLRGKASDADEKFVAKLAAKHGLEFHSASVHVGKKARKERANLEETARRARYDYFHSLARAGALTRIAVAHTADDQAETVLAHLLRGTGLTGLGGIHPVVGPVLRPLLNVRRSELRRFLRGQKQDWREDVTNLDVKRMRARIRRKLLPLLEKQFQPAVVEHLATLACLAREDEAFFDAVVKERAKTLVHKSGGRAQIAVEDLLKPQKKEETSAEKPGYVNFVEENGEATSALSKRLVREIVESVKLRAGQLGAKHVEAVLELARGGQSGRSIDLPGGVEVRRERKALVFQASEKATGKTPNGAARQYEYNIELENGGAEMRVTELGCAFRFKVIDWPPKRGETNERVAVLSRDRLRAPLVLRNWRAGDRLRPLGHGSAHKLKRLLNEKRVSRWERDGWPVLTSGGVVAWARGFPVAAEFAADENTRAGVVIAEESL